MERKMLGRTDMAIAPIVMGCWAIGGGYTWGEQDERESIATVQTAVSLGVTMFDTAEFYSDGYAEEVLGKGLAGMRSDVQIATKVWVDNLSEAKVVEACEGSLRRLRTDYIDLYQIHWPSREIPLEETLAAMERLTQSGKVRYLGVCNFGVQDLSQALRRTDIVGNQVAYNLLFRAIEHEILPACRMADVGVLAYSPLAQGLLTGKFARLAEVDDERARIRLYSCKRPGTVHDEAGCERQADKALEAIRMICAELGESMATVALAWVLQQPGIFGVLAGARTPEQISRNVEAARLVLAEETISLLSKETEALKNCIGNNADPWRSASRIR